MADLQQAQPDDSMRMEELVELLRQQAEAIQDLKVQLSRQITKEIANTTQQLEAHQALQSLIGDLPAPLHGWSISSDFALQLVRLIRDNQYDLIIEFGSGTSTLLSLRALERFGLSPDPHKVILHRLLTFEHLEAYYLKTLDLVATCANRLQLDLRLSELEPWADATGSYSYYSGAIAIAQGLQAACASAKRSLKLLVVIDGPPGGTCRWARYPAVPIVLDAVNGMDLSIDFLLDDMNRADEKELALAWEQRFQAIGLSYRRVDYNFKKGGLLLKVDRFAGVDTSLARFEGLAAEKCEQEAAATPTARVDELLAELAAAKQSVARELQQTQKARDEQAATVKGLEGELSKLKGERDAAAKEKAAAQHSAAELKQQLVAQAESLRLMQKVRDDLTAKTQGLEAELTQLQDRFQEAESKARSAARREQEAVAVAVARVDELLSELEAAKQSAAKELQQMQKARDEQAANVKGLERELSKLKGERDAAGKEMATAQQSAAELKHQLVAQSESLQQMQKAHDDLAAKKQGLEVELSQLQERLQESESMCQDRGVAIEHLQRELQDFRKQAVQLRQALQPQERWQLWLEQEQQALMAQRARFNAEVEQQAKDMRELEVLRTECARRFALLQRSDQHQLEQANQLKDLQHELTELCHQLEQLGDVREEQEVRSQAAERDVAELRRQLAEVEKVRDEQQGRLQASERDVVDLRRQLAERSPEVAEPAASEELQALERQLQEAHEESELLLLQLHHVQEQLEHYYLLSLNPPSETPQTQPVDPPRPETQSDTDAINAFRQRLLASR